MEWRCPVCEQVLAPVEGGLQCVNRHRFDRAREGYVNLLPSHRRHSRQPGDSRMMLRSRRIFLENGYYQALRDHLTERLVGLAAARARFTLLDAGCGEGYYTGHIAAELTRRCADTRIEVAGIDVARDAARLAARRYPGIDFAVASSAALPLGQGTLDALLRVFAPGYGDEARRVLRAGGHYLTVTPAAAHLGALRGLLYDHPRPHEDAPESHPGMTHIARETLRFPLRIIGEDVTRLLEMTPYYWQVDRARQQAVSELPELTTEAAFHLDLYRN